MRKKFKYDPKIYNHCETLGELWALARRELGVKKLSLLEKDKIEVAWREAVGRCHISNKKYTVYFHQDLHGYTDVYADNPLDAKRKVRELLNNGGIIVDDFTEFDEGAKVCNDVYLDEWEEEAINDN